MARQITAMMQQHEASIQRPTTSLEQQQMVMQHMEAARVATEDAHRQHMEALRQLEENKTTAPVHSPVPRPLHREWSLEDFLKHHLTKFNGKTSPDVADQWLKDIERIFYAQMCPEESRLAFAVYMLTGEAEHWWIMEERQEPVRWEVFRRKFLSKYFPDIIKYAKEMEFLQLTQGSKFVAKYAEKFKHLNRFYTMQLDEEWRRRKLENGLYGDLRLVVAKARVMEKMKVEVETQHPHQQRVGGQSGSKHSHEERRKPYTRPHFQS